MMLKRGRYHARLAGNADDLRAAQRLRWLAFIGKRGVVDDGAAIDADQYDDACHHVLIEDQRSGILVATFRFMLLESGTEIERSYSASHYDLGRLREFEGPMVEMGRFCIHPEHADPDILRVAWGAMTRFVDDNKVGLLFGCSSFMGTDAQGYADAFAMLKERHLAPRRWLPRVKAPKVFRFARALRLMKPDPRRAQAGLPPLLRSYLLMGGWVSDHAVVDEQLGTLHVFTGLEIAAIPPARQKLLRGVAG
ncbi:GNAT family N-acetyltransferase [Paracoccus sp. SCSIO 75233]|uniref:GNAT family N-acetyltransferase n=1 Tax=Paracoccus sp. SCSIO 75233 TaxID=3017782 RepID=UPI0022F0948D|nr:GNAT family N-acetyltransferase [Paracoccus sp. SCSIO 75233]WBU51781.1 GNAT family N-acetyltransferase [Paracoccus sp. SCSIO 75233]